MYEKIKSEIKEAMKNKDTTKRDVLKMVVDKAKAAMKEKDPTGSQDSIPNEVIGDAVRKELRQLQQTKDSLAGKEDSNLFVQTVAKMEILAPYVPQMMTKEEIEQEVSRILAAHQAQNFGGKMKLVMAELKGRADSKLIKEVVMSEG